MSKIERVAIANRGEVAVRIIWALRELGMQSVLLHSEADQNSLAYRLADKKVCIGPSPSNVSYLSIDANIQGARAAGAHAIHPGFGFLSESAEFAARCMESGFAFIGPRPESIRTFGDKISAKKLVAEAGGPVIPGYQGVDQSLPRLMKEAERIGFPVMVKATAGGGGRGLKVIAAAEESKAAIEAAKREGLSSFRSDEVFLEKYLNGAKHIEVQIFGDASGKIHVLGERECSVQRRHQKIIEESPSPSLSANQRMEIFATAQRIGERARYLGAGTIEFLLHKDSFYFLEMNTRLQVEHPVTEMVFGVDLVKAQILTAQGKSLSWPDRFTSNGHAIECRLYAENPYQGGIPATGKLGACHYPQAPGRRFEIGFEEGDEITSHYDSMFAKMVVWDESRIRCIHKALATLNGIVIFGVHTNIPLLKKMLSHPEFVAGMMTTQFVESHFPQGLKDKQITLSEEKMGEFLQRKLAADKSPAAMIKAITKADPWAFDWQEK